METQSRYGRVTDEVLALLAGIAGEKNVVTGEGLENYSHDEMPMPKPFLPEVVVKPDNSTQVSEILKLANQRLIPVTPRGGGTGLSGGAIPTHGGIVLSLERMNRIIEIDRANFVATVEAGVLLSDIFQAVAEHGLHYPLYPGEASAAIGGNVATNAGGMRAVKYGVTRHFVLGLEAVLPTGEIIQTGGKFVKNSTAYDLTQLLIGSEGTLAVVTRVLLRLIPPPGKMELLFIPFNSLHDAISSVPAILQRGILPVGIEFMEKDIIHMAEEYAGKEVPLHDYEAFLMIFLEGDNEEEIHRQAGEIGPICLSNGAVDVYSPATERAKRNLLDVREKFYYALKRAGMLDFADVVVPRSRIAEFVEMSHRTGEEYGIPVIAVGHAGDGNVHLAILGEATDEMQKKVKELLGRICREGVAMGGTISGEHGLGFTKTDYLPMVAGGGKMELMQRIKQAFDPNGIMNPGKIFS
ncbi:MAG TPA: FAD-binding protein [Dehalococcoidia bacterium]|nr:FAD-binding protein [Dehalococcoidia bacterium]